MSFETENGGEPKRSFGERSTRAAEGGTEGRESPYKHVTTRFDEPEVALRAASVDRRELPNPLARIGAAEFEVDMLRFGKLGQVDGTIVSGEYQITYATAAVMQEFKRTLEDPTSDIAMAGFSLSDALYRMLSRGEEMPQQGALIMRFYGSGLVARRVLVRPEGERLRQGERPHIEQAVRSIPRVALSHLSQFAPYLTTFRAQSELANIPEEKRIGVRPQIVRAEAHDIPHLEELSSDARQIADHILTATGERGLVVRPGGNIQTEEEFLIALGQAVEVVNEMDSSRLEAVVISSGIPLEVLSSKVLEGNWIVWDSSGAAASNTEWAPGGTPEEKKTRKEGAPPKQPEKEAPRTERPRQGRPAVPIDDWWDKGSRRENIFDRFAAQPLARDSTERLRPMRDAEEPARENLFDRIRTESGETPAKKNPDTKPADTPKPERENIFDKYRKK